MKGPGPSAIIYCSSSHKSRPISKSPCMHFTFYFPFLRKWMVFISSSFVIATHSAIEDFLSSRYLMY